MTILLEWFLSGFIGFLIIGAISRDIEKMLLKGHMPIKIIIINALIGILLGLLTLVWAMINLVETIFNKNNYRKGRIK